MIRAAIFDLDGVLLDSMHIWESLGADYLRKMQIEPEADLCKKLRTMSMEQGAEYIKKNYGVSYDVTDIVSDMGKMMEDFYFYDVKAKPGAVGFLQYLGDRGVRMAAATSGEKENAVKALDRLGLLCYLEFVITSAEVGCSKHDPLIYNQAAKKLGSLPEETLVLEDSLYALETAARAGFCTVGVYDHSSKEDVSQMKKVGKNYLDNLMEYKEIKKYDYTK